KRLGGIGERSILQRLIVNNGNGASDIYLSLGAVAYYYNFIQSRHIFFQSNVDNLSRAHGKLLGNITYKGKYQNGFLGYSNGILAIDICSSTYCSTFDQYRNSWYCLSARISYLSTNLYILMQSALMNMNCC